MPSKRVLLIISLILGKEKCHTKKPGEEELRWSFRLRTAKCSGYCEQVHYRGEAAAICSAIALVSTRAPNEPYAAGSPSRLTDGSSGKNWMRTMPFSSKNVINMTLNFDLKCLDFFALGDVGNFHWVLEHFVSGSYSKIRLSSSAMTLRRSTWWVISSVWRHSVMSWHICMLGLWYSFSNLDTIFPQIFCMPKSLVIIFQTLSLYKSSRQINIRSEMTISVHHLANPIDVDLSPLYWRPSAHGVILHLLTPFFEPLVPLKIRAYDMEQSPYTYWRMSSACDRVFPNRTKIKKRKRKRKIRVYFLLSVYRLFHSASSWMT